MGHHAGDRVLQGVATRLLNATRGIDTVARFGGDEFAVLVENARGIVNANIVAERILTSLRAPIVVAGGSNGGATREARVGASIGIALADLGVNADALLAQANAAMYQAKSEGKGRHVVFHPALVAAAAELLALESDLSLAMARGEFTLAYQPIVAVGSGMVESVEALLRWHHPTRGLVPPTRFIPLAEASGLIVALGRWVLDEACRAASAWPLGPTGARIGITVNVSGRQLDDPALPTYVAEALAASGLPGSQLTLEITESVLMRDTEATLTTLHALKELGVRLRSMTSERATRRCGICNNSRSTCSRSTRASSTASRAAAAMPRSAARSWRWRRRSVSGRWPRGSRTRHNAIGCV